MVFCALPGAERRASLCAFSLPHIPLVACRSSICGFCRGDRRRVQGANRNDSGCYRVDLQRCNRLRAAGRTRKSGCDEPLVVRPLETRLFFDGQFVVDLLDAINRTGDLDCLVHLLLVVHETAQLHFTLLGLDIDIGALDIGSGQ